MKDGLYRVCKCGTGFHGVSAKSFCAGFAIRGGKVVAVAPILRKRIKYWMTVAERVCD